MRIIDLIGDMNDLAKSEVQPREPAFVPDSHEEVYQALSEKDRNLVVLLANAMKYYKFKSIPSSNAILELIETLIGKNDLPAQWDIESFSNAMFKLEESAQYASDYVSVTEFRQNHIHRTKNRKDSK